MPGEKRFHSNAESEAIIWRTHTQSKSGTEQWKEIKLEFIHVEWWMFIAHVKNFVSFYHICTMSFTAAAEHKRTLSFELWASSAESPLQMLSLEIRWIIPLFIVWPKNERLRLFSSERVALKHCFRRVYHCFSGRPNKNHNSEYHRVKVSTLVGVCPSFVFVIVCGWCDFSRCRMA